MSSSVEHPSYYTNGKIEVWDFVIDQKLPYPLCDSIKYICRAGKKDKSKRIEDLRKALAYVNKQIEIWEKEDNDKKKGEQEWMNRCTRN